MTEESFLQLCEHLANNLWLQSLLIITGTCFLEDAGRCAVALLVAARQVSWSMAVVSMTLGGMVGDIGLYLIGRYGTFIMEHQHWIDRKRLQWMEEYFKSHAIKTVIVSRFVPGARTLAFSAAGIVRYPFPRYLLLLFIAAFSQALIFLKVGAYIGEHFLPYLRNPVTRLVVVISLLGAGVVMHVLISAAQRRKMRREANQAQPADAVPDHNHAERPTEDS